MASNIKFKRSAVQNRVPTTAQLDLGELALNTYDGKLYTEINTGSATVVEIGSKLSSLVVDGDNGGGGGDVVFHGATAGRDLTWDYSHNTLSLADNVLLGLGNSNDLLIHHTGSTGYIKGQTGNLYIQSDQVVIIGNQSASTAGLKFINGGATELFHNNLLRISTTADGADIGGTGSLKLPVGTTAQRNSSPVAGDIRYNTTTGGFEGYSSSWGELGGGGIGIGSTAVNPASGLVTNRIGVGFTDINVVGTGISVTGYGSTIVLDFNDFKPGSFNRSIHNYTATAGQTTFAGLSYDNAERQIAVYLNGARLSEATYTATSGTTVVLDVGASVGDEVEIINININSDVDRNVNTYTATAGQTTFTGLSYNSITELDVYLNGIRLATGDYTATTGNTVVLNVGASVNDIVDIVSTGDGVSFRSTADTSGDKFTLTNVGIGTDQTPDKLNVTGNVNIVGVLTATTLHGDGSNLTNTGSTLSEPSSGTQRLVTTSLTTGTMTSSGTGSELAFDYANNELEFSDNTKALFGTGGDLAIYHNGSHSFIDDTGTGNLKVRSNNFRVSNADESKISATFVPSGAVELYHNDTLRLETRTNDVKFHGGLVAVDNVKIQLGSSGDLQLFHDGTNSYVSDPIGIGNLRIRINTGQIELQPKIGEYGLICKPAGAVELYHNNIKKVETSSTGLTLNASSGSSKIDITGLLNIDGTTGVHLQYNGTSRVQTTSNGTSIQGASSLNGAVTFLSTDASTAFHFNAGNTSAARFNAKDGRKFSCGDGNDLLLYHDGTRSHLSNSTGELRLGEGGANVELYYGSVKCLHTHSDNGGSVGIFRNLTANDNTKIMLGASADLQIYHSGSHSIIHDTGTGNLTIQSNAGEIQLAKGGSFEHMVRCIVDGAVELYHNGTKRFETTSGGAKVFGDLVVDGNLTNEDVTTISSVGIITAQNGINVTGGNINLGDSANTSNHRIFMGADNDMFMYHNGTHGVIENTTGNLHIKDDSIKLQNSNSTTRLEVHTSGVTVSGNISVSGTVDGIDLQTLNSAVATNTAKVSNATHTGDVTGSTALTIANNAVTESKISNNSVVNAKLADMQNSRIIGRVSSGTGDPEYLTASSVRSMINVENGATADQSASEILTLLKTVDGSGSGLDADTLDGVQGSSFLRSDAADVMSQGTQGTATLDVRNTGGAGSGTDTGAIIAEFKGDSDALRIRNIGGGDYGIYNIQQNNGIEIYDGTGGVRILYNGSTSIEFDSGNNYGDFKGIPTVNGTNLVRASDTIASATNADTVDSLHATSFLRSDANDTLDGNLTFAAGHYIKRADNKSGFFTGLHGSGSNNDTHSNPIYTIGPNYNPALTTLGNMYGIGYTHGGNSSFGPGGAWGLYVAADGDARIFLDASYGRIYINDGNTIIQEGDGNGIRIQTNNGYVDIGSMNTSYAHFQTDRTQFYFNKQVIVNGNIKPYSNNNFDLGDSSNRWANIYVNDLQLSNEAKKDEGGNDVDGTWGNFTIQEGENDLYLINNRNGKKYKFNLTEVQ